MTKAKTKKIVKVVKRKVLKSELKKVVSVKSTEEDYSLLNYSYKGIGKEDFTFPRLLSQSGKRHALLSYLLKNRKENNALVLKEVFNLKESLKGKEDIYFSLIPKLKRFLKENNIGIDLDYNRVKYPKLIKVIKVISI